MAVPEPIRRLAGAWEGRNSLWLMPGEPVRESRLSGTWSLLGNEQFATFAYSWSDEGVEQDGLLLLAFGTEAGAAQAAWVDSFHTMQGIMAFEGSVDAQGLVRVECSYPAPSGPDWRWRIEVEPGAGAWTLRMFNITPDGQELKAVEASPSRVA